MKDFIFEIDGTPWQLGCRTTRMTEPLQERPARKEDIVAALKPHGLAIISVRECRESDEALKRIMASAFFGTLQADVAHSVDECRDDGLRAVFNAGFAVGVEDIADLRRRAPAVRSVPNADAGDFTEICSVCSAEVTTPHSASDCFKQGRQDAENDKAIDAERERVDALEREELFQALRELVRITAHVANQAGMHNGTHNGEGVSLNIPWVAGTLRAAVRDAVKTLRKSDPTYGTTPVASADESQRTGPEPTAAETRVDAYSIGSRHCPGLSKLGEESGEVVQVIGKIQGFGGFGMHWDGSDLSGRLEEEIGDIIAAVAFVVKHNGLSSEAIEVRSEAKLALFETWHAEGLARHE